MKHLKPLNAYFWKYRWRLFLGIFFISLSNYFAILAPQLTGFIVDEVQRVINPASPATQRVFFDPLVLNSIQFFNSLHIEPGQLILYCGLLLLSFALLRGFFMFLMRQTIIVMSRHIEYDQKNEVYAHYQKLDMGFFKMNSTGDLMSRMSEDVSRVRMYTGPALMYLVNLTVLIGFSLFFMFKKDPLLSLYVLAPLPILAVTMYFVNDYINKKSEKIQAQLSQLTAIAQESYSGIRVIKSYDQEKSTIAHFDNESDAYRKSGLSLSTLEAIYFPSIGLLIGISTLITIYIGSIYQLEHRISSGTIAEFVVYINMLTFPVSAIGWVASNIQRASASQKRLNEFLDTTPKILESDQAEPVSTLNSIQFNHVNFTFPHTGIKAIRDFTLTIRKGEKIALMGKTGCGKSTLAHLILRMYDPESGEILINGTDLRVLNLGQLRQAVSYVPQDVFLFSDSIHNNILFGSDKKGEEIAVQSAKQAMIFHEIESLPNGMNTVVGERGVTLSGGQKQRISIARAIAKESEILILDDCLSAVDANTEVKIASNLASYLSNRTALIITHRILPSFTFDKIVVMSDGAIAEMGTHEELMRVNGLYAEMVSSQMTDSTP